MAIDLSKNSDGKFRINKYNIMWWHSVRLMHSIRLKSRCIVCEEPLGLLYITSYHYIIIVTEASSARLVVLFIRFKYQILNLKIQFNSLFQFSFLQDTDNLTPPLFSITSQYHIMNESINSNRASKAKQETKARIRIRVNVKINIKRFQSDDNPR